MGTLPWDAAPPQTSLISLALVSDQLTWVAGSHRDPHPDQGTIAPIGKQASLQLFQAGRQTASKMDGTAECAQNATPIPVTVLRSHLKSFLGVSRLTLLGARTWSMMEVEGRSTGELSQT